MVRGVQWHFYGVPVANPDKDERCVGSKLGPIAARPNSTGFPSSAVISS